MRNLIFLAFCMALMVVPVSATTSDGGVVDGIFDDPGAAETVEETDSAVQEESGEAAALAADGDLAGGYYFVADCALGENLKFYIPVEWSHNVLTLDSSGAPVNLSSTTCYAYCPDYPDYTISCSRFGTFTYRATNYSTTDLLITEISDSNIVFASGQPMSDDVFNYIFVMLLLLIFAVVVFWR